MGQKFKITALIGVGALAGALTTVSLQTLARADVPALPLDELQQLAAVFGMIKRNYVEPVDDKKLITDAIAGMVAGLDPHSVYLDKKALKDFNEGTSGRFVGVGIEITQEDGLIKVVSPIEGSPAHRAGLQSGDLIVKINDTQVKGMTLNEGVKRMRGEPNTQVHLSVFRKAENRTFPVTITREEIKTVSVKAKLVEPGYGWVRITQFQERTVADFARKVEDLYKQSPGLKGLVLDLRNDPGGFLDAAVAVSAAFLPTDVTVVSANGQLPESQFTYKAAPRYYARRGDDPIRKLEKTTAGALKKVPLVVLVNEGSASASEIVAGALQDHKRATLMGGQTFGKGSVQTAVCLEGGYRLDNCPSAALKLTTSRYYTPSGRSIQAKGIVPDVWVDETPEGNLFAALQAREADFDKHLSSGQEDAQAGAQVDKAREAEREAARQKLEAELKKNPSGRRLPEFGTDKDFPLLQALAQLKGQPVQASKTARERKPAAKPED